MSALFRLSTTWRRDPAVDTWLREHGDALGESARHWFAVMRVCGDDVREALHDGCPTACVGDAAFAYVNVFRRHASVGFFQGAELPDPARLLEGSGKFMRHVKLRPEDEPDARALRELILRAYEGMKGKVGMARR